MLARSEEVTQAIKGLSGDKYNKDTGVAKTTEEDEAKLGDTSAQDTDEGKQSTDPLADLM